MRFLIFGAGVLGSFYAVKLLACGHDVTVLARGRRAAQLRAEGLVVQEHSGGGQREQVNVNVIETLAPEAAYDYVLVLVRNDQVESVLPLLAASQQTPCIVFMFNNLEGPARLIQVLGRERVLLGFPGAAGARAADGSVVATVLPAWMQMTTLGEIDGRNTLRLRLLAKALTKAGFPTALSTHMDAWLKTHVAVVSPIADAFYAAGDDLKALGHSKPRVTALLRTIRQTFLALRAQGIPVTPARLRGLELSPDWLLVPACQWALCTAFADLVVARHATVARAEMSALSGQLRALVARSTGIAAKA